MSRLANVRTAVRPALKSRLLLAGPSGSGKTRTALMIAEILNDTDMPTLLIDSEESSALTYADLHAFDHLPWLPPFDPRELTAVIIEAGRSYGVVIVDSLSHFWQKDGGTLSIADGKFTNWKDARPVQEELHLAIQRCGAHVIVCARSKQKHSQVDDPDRPGRQKVVKLGVGVVQDDQLEYDVNLAIDIDMTHEMTVSKSRIITVPVGRSFPAGHAEDFAKVYADWLKGGEPPAAADAVTRLVERMNSLNEDGRKACKQQFVARFGRPEYLRATQLGEAEQLVAEAEARQGAKIVDETELVPPASTEPGDSTPLPSPGSTLSWLDELGVTADSPEALAVYAWGEQHNGRSPVDVARDLYDGALQFAYAADGSVSIVEVEPTPAERNETDRKSKERAGMAKAREALEKQAS